jgi:hypothetical protein
MTIEMEGRSDTKCWCGRRSAGQARHVKFVTVTACAVALNVSVLPLTGRRPAHAAEITFRCVNQASGTTWNLEIDDEHQTADSLPAEITTTRIMWHDVRRGGFYELDRNSGLLTFRNASSTGGYILYHRCHEN